MFLIVQKIYRKEIKLEYLRKFQKIKFQTRSSIHWEYSDKSQIYIVFLKLYFMSNNMNQ